MARRSPSIVSLALHSLAATSNQSTPNHRVNYRPTCLESFRWNFFFFFPFGRLCQALRRTQTRERVNPHKLHAYDVTTVVFRLLRSRFNLTGQQNTLSSPERDPAESDSHPKRKHMASRMKMQWNRSTTEKQHTAQAQAPAAQLIFC